MYVDDDIYNARLARIKTRLDAASTAGLVKSYSGTAPANGGAITSQTLLSSQSLSKPCGTLTRGQLAFDVVADDMAADNTGTVGFVRLVDGDGVFVIDLPAGNQASNAPAKFATLDVIAGSKVACTSIVLTDGVA